MPQALQQLELCSRLCGRPSTHSPCNWEIAPSAHYPGREDPLEQRQAPHSSILRLPSGSAGKESACSARGLGSVPGLGRSLKEKATHSSIPGLPWWLSWERIRLQCRRPRFNPGLGRSPGEGKGPPLQCPRASLAAQLVKNLPVLRETRVRSLGWEDPLEKGQAPHSSALAWRARAV